jgi:glutaredoxin 3
MPAIVMYTKSWCPYCDRAKALLRDKGQSWAEIDIEAQDGRRAEMIERSGRSTVPQIWIGDRHVGGFDELAELERRGELDALLGRAKGPARQAEHAKVLIVGMAPPATPRHIHGPRRPSR